MHTRTRLDSQRRELSFPCSSSRQIAALLILRPSPRPWQSSPLREVGVRGAAMPLRSRRAARPCSFAASENRDDLAPSPSGRGRAQAPESGDPLLAWTRDAGLCDPIKGAALPCPQNPASYPLGRQAPRGPRGGSARPRTHRLEGQPPALLRPVPTRRLTLNSPPQSQMAEFRDRARRWHTLI